MNELPKPYVAKNGISVRMIKIEAEGKESLSGSRLLDLSIRHEPNEHGRAYVLVETDGDAGRKFMEDAKFENKLKISVGKENQLIFCGNILEANLKNRESFSYLSVELADTSYMSDIKQKSESFQNSKKTYQDILTKAFGSDGTIKLQSNLNKPIEKLVMQVGETNWEFAKRLASRFNVPLISDITAPKCSLFLGLNEGSGEFDLTTSSVSKYVEAEAFENVSKNLWLDKEKAMIENFSGLRAESYDYAYLGNNVKLNGESYYIRKVFGKLSGGVLKMTYDLTQKATGFWAPSTKHSNLAGRIMTGAVKTVKKDKIQVHFVDIDKNYDSSSDTWFPYATAYSSKDGSGWYVMPEEGDYVRILFPTNEESEAFASSAINLSPIEKVRNKSFKAPGGKEILLTDTGVEIICEHQKLFAKLEKGKGISLISNKNINVSADGDISMESKGRIQIVAKKSIDLQAGSSHIKILSDQVSVGGNNIKLGE